MENTKRLLIDLPIEVLDKYKANATKEGRTRKKQIEIVLIQAVTKGRAK